ncbi:MAG: glycosyltransferase family 2 protein [Chloroflexi bacterium]|nr:glycosyltransferase family 2 protein [Chloroflexota bacterium]
MPPTISIGIPTYNRAGLAQQAIQSVLQQTYQDFEIIVSDDCSTDETAQVIQDFHDPRIRYHRTLTNLRPPRNWNECVRLARGEFFALLPDDDVYCPTFLEGMVAALVAKPEVGFAQCGYYSVDEHLRCIQTRLSATTPLTLKADSAVIWQLQNLACIPAAILFRREAMLDLRLWRERTGYWDDWAFIVRLAYRSGFNYVPQALACNRVHAQNLNRTLRHEDRDAILDLLNQQADVFGETLPLTTVLESFRARLNRELSQHCVLLALSALRRADWSRARFHFRRAHHLYAWAGFDPGFIKLRLNLRSEAVREAQLRQAAQAREPIVKLDRRP